MENQTTQTETQEVQGTGFKVGDIFYINGRNVGGKDILKDRLFHYSKDSKKPGLVNGHLVNPKTGKLQRTEIAIPVDALEAVETLPAQIQEAEAI